VEDLDHPSVVEGIRKWIEERRDVSAKESQAR
jgi:hypothetical protein